MTSSEIIEADDEKTYETLQIDYSKEFEGQRYAISYIDEAQFRVEEGGSFNVLGKRDLYDFASFIGHLYRLNIVYNFYEKNNILFQGRIEGQIYRELIEFSKPIPASLTTVAEKIHSPHIIKEFAEKNILSHSNSCNTANLNEIFNYSNSDLCAIAKKDGPAYYEENRKEIFNIWSLLKNKSI